jgi:ABC-type branched-subunit amino acid transport system ATPase component
MSILTVVDVNKCFGGLAALSNVNLEVEAGTIHAIIGPNGAGKSTLLNCFVGRPEPDSGSVTFDVKLLLLDEPYEGLAPVIVHEIEKTLEQIKDLGITTVIVEQNAIAALHLASRAIILEMGQVVFDGTAQEVLDNADTRQQYLAI